MDLFFGGADKIGKIGMLFIALDTNTITFAPNTHTRKTQHGCGDTKRKQLAPVAKARV